MKLSESDMQRIADTHNITANSFKRHYRIAKKGSKGIVVFQTTYERTSHARFPEDGKLRDLNSEFFWMTVINQSIMPKPGEWSRSPLPYSIIYT